MPLLAGLGYALLNSFGVAGILSGGFTLMYWREVFTTGEFLNAFFFSLYITLAVIVLSLIFAMLLRNLLQNNLFSGFTSYVFYIPLAIPFIVAAFLSYQLLGQAGLFSRIVYALHITTSTDQFPDLVNDVAGIGIICTHVIITTVFLTILFATIFRQEKVTELMQAASTLGADKKHISRRIVIPLLLRRARPSIILYTVFIFGSYEIPLLLGRQDPQMVSVAIARKFQRYNLQDVPVAYAMAAFYTLLIILILFLLYRNKKLTHENSV